MGIEPGFEELQGAADAPTADTREARRRRDVFTGAFKKEGDVTDAWGSGSVSRSTQRDPIHDVDVVVVFDEDAHSGWGQDGSSAHDALEYTRALCKKLLGTDGTEGQEIRHTLLRQHAVTCFLDEADDPNAFTVDVTPALARTAGGLWIPEVDQGGTNNGTWIATDPANLKRLVAARQADWILQRPSDARKFRELVRILKRWNDDHGGLMKSLVIEVLALTHLHVEPTPRALARFFTGAATAIVVPVCDPSNLCGEIQPDLDKAKVRELFNSASTAGWEAVNAADGSDEGEKTAMCLWRQVFGSHYPEPEGGCSSLGAGAAAGAATNIEFPRKRPLKDAPQG